MKNWIRRVLRPRTSGAVLSVGLLGLFGGPLVEQCAPAPAPAYTGVGHCAPYMSDNGISGGYSCASAPANGFTQFRVLCKYTVNRPDYSFNMNTTGPLVNPPDAAPHQQPYPELTRVDSRCPVPDMSYQPAGSWPHLNSVHLELY